MKAVAQVGSHYFAMSISAAAEVVRLLGNAVEVEWDHSEKLGEFYRHNPKFPATIEMKVVPDEKIISSPKSGKVKAITEKASADCHGPCIPAN